MQLSILITGANRGIGLELVKQLLTKKNPKHIFAACRNPDKAEALKQLAATHSAVRIIALDVTIDATIDSAVQQVSSVVGKDGLGVLINNAGLLTKESIENVTRSGAHDIFNINTIGPLIVTQKFLPLLKMAAASTAGSSLGWQNSIVSLTSGYGSIGENNSGGVYSYRGAKAALNMMTKSLSVDLKSDKIMAVSLNPGWVSSDMGGSRAPVTPQDCVSSLITVLDNLSVNDNGKALSRKGVALPY